MVKRPANGGWGQVDYADLMGQAQIDSALVDDATWQELDFMKKHLTHSNWNDLYQQSLQTSFSFRWEDKDGKPIPVAPSEGDLLMIPGYNSGWKRSWRTADEYYEHLMMDWSERSEEDRKEAVSAHKSLVKRYTESAATDALWKIVNEQQTIPPATVIEPWPIDNPPFATIEEFERAMMFQALMEVEWLKPKFNVPGPRTFHYQQKALKFIGMETFALEAVRVNELPNGDRAFVFYLKAMDASVVSKLYGLTEAQVTSLLGGDVGDWLVDHFDEFSKKDHWPASRALVEQRVMKERYAGTGMEFGGWA